MLIAALSVSDRAALAVLLGWALATSLAWLGARSARERLAGSCNTDLDPTCPLWLAGGVSLGLAALVCVRSGTLQTAAEIFFVWGCTAPLLQTWMDARAFPKPRRGTLPPMDDAIGGARGSF